MKSAIIPGLGIVADFFVKWNKLPYGARFGYLYSRIKKRAMTSVVVRLVLQEE